MLRRLATALLVVAVALGGLTSAACASGACQLSAARMKCCPGEGLRADRRCCDSTIATAAPQAAAAFERAPQVPPLAALPALMMPAAPRLPGRAVGTVPVGGTGPPGSLIAQHTSLLV